MSCTDWSTKTPNETTQWYSPGSPGQPWAFENPLFGPPDTWGASTGSTPSDFIDYGDWYASFETGVKDETPWTLQGEKTTQWVEFNRCFVTIDVVNGWAGDCRPEARRL